MPDNCYLFIDGEFLRQRHLEVMRSFFDEDGDLDFLAIQRQAVTENPLNDINGAMFSLGPAETLGNAPRDFLRSSPFENWDFSMVKDTAIPRINEKANPEFRTEFFDILNHANLGVSGGAFFTGAIKDLAPYSEALIGAPAADPLGTAGQITAMLRGRFSLL